MRFYYLLKREQTLTLIIGVLLFLSNTGLLKAQLGFNNHGCYVNIKTGTILNVDGNVTLENNGQLNNSGEVEIKGDWLNNSGTTGFSSPNDGTVNFSGNDQHLGGTSTTNFNNINLNQATTSSTITLQSQITVTGVFTFTSGYVISSSANLLTFGNSSSLSGVSDNSFVEGPVQKIGSTFFVFPIGKSAYYHPLTISAPAVGTDAYTAQYFAANQTFGSALQTGSLESISNCEYWLLTRTAGTSIVVPSLGWNSNSCNIQSYQDLRVAGWDGSEWKSMGNTGVTVNGNTGTLTGLSGINTSSLPITIGVYQPAVKPYATLKKQLDGGFYTPVQDKMYFKFKGEYTQGALNYTVYDAATGTIIPSLPINTTILNYGDNRYELNLSSALTPLGKFYTLEVKDEKNVSYYLKFKY